IDTQHFYSNAVGKAWRKARYEFTLHTRNRELELGSSDKLEAEGWIERLQDSISVATETETVNQSRSGSVTYNSLRLLTMRKKRSRKNRAKQVKTGSAETEDETEWGVPDVDSKEGALAVDDLDQETPTETEGEGEGEEDVDDSESGEAASEGMSDGADDEDESPEAAAEELFGYPGTESCIDPETGVGIEAYRVRAGATPVPVLLSWTTKDMQTDLLLSPAQTYVFVVTQREN
ncbi:hypothetical protein KIPB_010524, partial [Kipferlia bialata]